MDMENKPKRYEIIGYSDNGDEIRLYDDGSKRNQYGHILERPPYDGIQTITKDNAHEYLKRRKEKILESIEKSVMNVTKTRLPSDAIGAIVGKRAEIAMTDDTRTGNEAAKIVLQAIDAYQNRVTDSQQTVNNVYSMDSETLETLRRIADIRNSTDVLDVDATDSD